jgi:hypothetical protein
MLKRTYSEFETNGTNESNKNPFIQIPLQHVIDTNYFPKKLKSQSDTFTEHYNDITIMLTNISIMIEKISLRIESCEKKIEYLYNCQIKYEQEKIEQKIRDTEIFNSYIN